MQLNTVLSDWLLNNKISGDTQREFGISFDEKIIIPVHDENGNFLYNKYRRSPLSEEGPKYWYDKGGKVELFAWHKAKGEDKVLITEGEKDCLVAWSHNIPAVSSTGGAQSFQKEWDDLFMGKEVTICFDNDSAGGEGMVKALSIIPWAKVLFLPDRPNIKDISDYVNNGGDLHELLKTAQTLNTLEDVHADRLKRIATYQSVHFHDAYIKTHTKRVPRTEKRKTYDNDAVTNANLYPIPNLIEFKKGKALCPFHNEKTPSLTYYEKDNHCYCFGCGKPYSAINIYMNKYQCSFKEAVKALNKL